MFSFITQISEHIINTIGSLGYIGIFFLMMVESTIFPLPSELILIPAGVIAQRGDMSILLITVFSTIGSLAGSLLMYFLSFRLGRRIVDKLIVRYGRLFFLNERSFLQAEKYFNNHGEITIFLSRLLPVVRHLISIPAGFSKMNLFKFSFYTALGSAFWSLILIYLGYFLGKALALKSASLVVLVLSILSILVAALYFWVKKNKI